MNPSDREGFFKKAAVKFHCRRLIEKIVLFQKAVAQSKDHVSSVLLSVPNPEPEQKSRKLFNLDIRELEKIPSVSYLRKIFSCYCVEIFRFKILLQTIKIC